MRDDGRDGFSVAISSIFVGRFFSDHLGTLTIWDGGKAWIHGDFGCSIGHPDIPAWQWTKTDKMRASKKMASPGHSEENPQNNIYVPIMFFNESLT